MKYKGYTSPFKGHNFDHGEGDICRKCGAVHIAGWKGHNFDHEKGDICKKCGKLHIHGRKVCPVSKEKFVELYEQYNLRTLGKMFGVAHSTVNKWGSEFGIKLRKGSEIASTTIRKKREPNKRTLELAHKGVALRWKRIRERPIEVANELLKKYGNPHCELWIDTREPKSLRESIKRLVNISIKEKSLPCGDYWLLGKQKVVLERKSAGDFISSLRSGRLWHQYKMLKAFEQEGVVRVYLMLEGNLNYASKWTKMPISSVASALAATIGKWNIPILYSPTKLWTPLILASIFKVAIEPPKHKLHPITFKPKAVTLSEKQRRILESYPGVGAVRAINFLEHFSNICNFVNATSEELKAVKKTPKKVADEISTINNAKFINPD